MSSKAYSTRLNTEDRNQYEIAVILDCLDSDSSGLLNSSDWLLQAALMRQEHDRNAELRDYAPTKEYIPLIEDQIHPKEEPIDIVEQVTTPEEYLVLSEDRPIEVALQHLLAAMSAEEKGNWLKQAALMRFSIEQDVPGYFINRWAPKDHLDPEEDQVRYEIENRSPMDQNEALSEPEEAFFTEAEVTGDHAEEKASEAVDEPRDDGFNVYRSALPNLLRLEVFQHV